MKAIVIKEFGTPEKLVVEETMSPRPKEDEIIIQMKYAPIN